jgi:Mg2+ and Co2+ transporter CorA
MSESPQGFIDILLLLLLITGIQIVLFRWRRWL